MKYPLIAKAAAVAAIAFGSMGIAQAAHARTDVFFSLGVPAPAYVVPDSSYARPPVVYAAPGQVYVNPGYDWRWRREQLRRAELRREEWRREHWRHDQWERSQGHRWHQGDDRRDWD
jgi:hypothetical protein